MAMKYQVVLDDLIDKISTNRYRPGDQLPSATVLCDQYSVSKITIKKALDELETRGYISKRRGSGSFVKMRPPAPTSAAMFETSHQMSGFKAEHEALGHKVTTQVHGFNVIVPPRDVAERLGMGPDAFAYHIIRVRRVDGTAASVEYIYLPIDVIPGLRSEALSESLYRFIEDELNLKIASAHRIVRAVLPTLDECDWLGIRATSPLLEVEQVAFLDDGRPFEYSVSRHPNGYQFRGIATR